ncbi:MAG: T9SS type A sorting domain-containing protein [Bacteroidetes bacterium]|nr:T9SS type A sorting domain-containing protein [Bacteroidota bacterium]
MIKKITLFVALCATTMSVNAQMNFDVNNWSSKTTPVFWGAPLNDFSAFLGDTSVVRETGRTDFGAKLKPTDLSAFQFPAYATFFTYGQDGGGAKIAASFDSVFFYVKQTSGGTDLNLNVSMATTLNNGDTVAFGEIDVTGDLNTFARRAFKMIVRPGMTGVTADSMSLTLLGLSTTQTAPGQSFSIVDDFGLKGVSGTVGLADLAREDVLVYPTLTKDVVNFELASSTADKLLVFSLDGKMVMDQTFAGATKTISVKELMNGTYIYKIMNADAQVATGKFVVSK